MCRPRIEPEANLARPKHPDIPADIEDFLEHWRAIPKTGLVPNLGDFLAAPPFKLQSEVSITDVLSPDDMRIRLFGTGLSSLAGHDLTGTDALSNFHVDARAEAQRLIWNSVSRPCGYYFWRYLRRGSVQTRVISIGLPLRHEQSGRLGLVGFSSPASRDVQIVDDESPFVRDMTLIRWIDIGGGVPPA